MSHADKHSAVKGKRLVPVAVKLSFRSLPSIYPHPFGFVPGQLLLDFHWLAGVEFDPEAHGKRLLSH